jgi:phage N-6-adenine-methyltransferase
MSTTITKPRQNSVTRKNSGIPTLAQMILDGQKSATKIRQKSEEALREWFKQSERLNIAKTHYKLKGARFIGFANRIGVDKSSAYRLVMLWQHRAAITSRCLDEAEAASKRGEPFRYPGWETALEWFEEPSRSKLKPLAEAKKYIAELEDRLSKARYGKMGRAPDQERETPGWLYRHFDQEFHFTCDAAASAKNHKHRNHFTKQRDALKQVWRGVIWLNPPWNEIGAFIKKAYEAAQAGATVVCLVPLWSTEKWFLEYGVHGKIRILSDRVAFVGYDQKAPQCLCVIVFTKGSRRRADGSLYIKIEEIEAPAKPKYADKTATMMSRGFAVL